MFSIALRGFSNKKTARSFFAEIYRSGNAAGDSCKATLWHTQTIRLELLHSCPDTVHGITLHKTLRSTFLTARKPSINFVEKGIRFCYSGLQIQGAANSPPTRSLYIIKHFIRKSKRFCRLFYRLCVWTMKILSKKAEKYVRRVLSL